MTTPYVKISTIREFSNWDNILGYRPVMVIKNKWGNSQTAHMGYVNPLYCKLWHTEESAQVAYDNGRPESFRPMCVKYPEIDTDELKQIEDEGLWRVI